MPRRYEIKQPYGQCWGLTDSWARWECSAESLERDNNPGDIEGVASLTLGQSVTLGGGAAPITVITCIEE